MMSIGCSLGAMATQAEVLAARAKRLTDTMKRRNISYTMLARACGLSYTTIRHFASGTRDMHLQDVRDIASALQVEPSWLAWG